MRSRIFSTDLRRPDGLLFLLCRALAPAFVRSPGRAVSGCARRPAPQAPEHRPRRSQTRTSLQARYRPARSLSCPESHRCTTLRTSAAAWAVICAAAQRHALHTPTSATRRRPERMSGAAPLQAQPPASGGVPHSAVQRQADIPAVWARFFSAHAFRFPLHAFSIPVHSQRRCTCSAPHTQAAPTRRFYRAVQAYSG